MSFLRSSINALVLTKAINRLHAAEQTRSIQRWVAPTLRELRKRSKNLGPQAPQSRASFVEWNYRAELFAFGKRLHEQFELQLLQTAFTQPSYIVQEQQRQHDLGIEDVDLQMTDNTKLAERGAHLAREYVQAFIQFSLPKVPAEGQQAFAEHLLSVTTVANIANHLGMRDLIFSAEYPPTQESLAQSLFAVVGALAQSSNTERSYLFIRDFICTQLNQRDLSELWYIAEPEVLLRKICEERNISELEPRLLGDCGKNTVLAAFHVGLYDDKKQLLGKGFGEDIATAVKSASLDALQELFGIQDNMKPLNFKLKFEAKNV